MTPDFIMGLIQNGRRKPKKYKHWVRIPDALFAELVDNGVIDPEKYYADEIVFFQFDGDTVTLNFQTLCNSEDFYAKVTNYLLIELMGANPVERGGIFF
jgi:hypothetical protein